MSGSSFTVAPARFQDLRGVAEIQKLSFPPGLAYGYWQLVLLWLLPNVRFLVATSSSSVLTGCVLADTHHNSVRVVNIAVHPEYRRQGLGSLLLDSIEEELPEGDVTLMVEEFNDQAKALYIRHGFRQVGVHRNYYGRNRNGISMRKNRTGSTFVVT